jgi:hypothetical protein
MTGVATDHSTTLELAASLLALAMQESHAPVGALGAALERMARALTRVGKALERQRAGTRRAAGGLDAAAVDIVACHETFEREIAACVEGLQFHDRLMQQLAHVRNCLAELSHKSAVQNPEGEESWLHLRAKLWHRLSSDSQRALLDLLLPIAPTHLGAEPRRMNASEGSIELF